MSENYQYDVVIVGGGPAGLSAARTTARLGFSTLVLERASEVGQTGHPCSAILAPMPGFVKGRRLLGDLFYPELDLLIPLSLVVGYPRLYRFISPDGHRVEAPFARGDSSPVAAIDKGGLLRLLAEQAQSKGAEIRCGAEAKGLITENGRVVGVKTAAGEFRSEVVLAAEGTSRRLSREAGLFRPDSRSTRHALIASRTLDAPAVRRPDLGQITTFGKRYTSAHEGFGTIVMPMPGRATVYFTLLSGGLNSQNIHPVQFYLDEYIQGDPRVRDLLAGSHVVEQSACTVAIEQGPVRVARAGFLSIGDAATPAGHVGLLGALWLGRQAALVTTEALDTDDVSSARLNNYGTLFHNRVLNVLKAERKMMLSLADMPDADLDRLTQAVAALPMSAPFFGGWQAVPWEAARWLAKHYPAGENPSGLVERILDEDMKSRTHSIEVPAGLWSMRVSDTASLS